MASSLPAGMGTRRLVLKQRGPGWLQSHTEKPSHIPLGTRANRVATGQGAQEGLKANNIPKLENRALKMFPIPKMITDTAVKAVDLM